jgi:4-amino-4-deoxy-L-arabinose transferase-like glycosyltransferase
MNALLAALALALGIGVSVILPKEGPSAIVVGAGLATIAGILVYRIKEDRRLLLQFFVAGLLIRVAVGSAIYLLGMQGYFGGDAFTYDDLGYLTLKVWQGETYLQGAVNWYGGAGAWGMLYLVASVYWLVGRNMLAIQFVNAAIGSATGPVVYLCAQHIFQNRKVSIISAALVTFFPSLIIWSAQGLKDAPIVLLLTLCMWATLKLGDKFSFKYFLLLICAMFGILSMRFYIFYMLVASISGAFVIGMRPVTSQSLIRQVIIIFGIGLAMTYLGVVRMASSQFETFGSLEAVQRSRSDLAQTGKSGFAADVDVSTTSGAITVIPIGMTYLLLAPFPWQYEITNIRQSFTLPEMIFWWCSIPLLVVGLLFALKYRLRQTLPILLFTSMLTLAYSVFQGNVGTAYRQRSQLLVFYFIFVCMPTWK